MPAWRVLKSGGFSVGNSRCVVFTRICQRIGGFILLFMGALSGSAQADWRDAALSCGNAAAIHYHCVSCSALWPQIVRCAAKEIGADKTKTERCIRQINNEDWDKPLYVDRVAQVFTECLGK